MFDASSVVQKAFDFTLSFIILIRGLTYNPFILHISEHVNFIYLVKQTFKFYISEISCLELAYPYELEVKFRFIL